MSDVPTSTVERNSLENPTLKSQNCEQAAESYRKAAMSRRAIIRENRDALASRRVVSFPPSVSQHADHQVALALVQGPPEPEKGKFVHIFDELIRIWKRS